MSQQEYNVSIPVFLDKVFDMTGIMDFCILLVSLYIIFWKYNGGKTSLQKQSSNIIIGILRLYSYLTVIFVSI